MDKNLEIGSHVVFVTPDRERLSALVTAVHSQGDANEHFAKYGLWPCVNVVFVTNDEAKQDPYGRQIARQSSASHGKSQGLPQGNCWLWPDEV
jgi:hypothetical protein